MVPHARWCCPGVLVNCAASDGKPFRGVTQRVDVFGASDQAKPIPLTEANRKFPVTTPLDRRAEAVGDLADATQRIACDPSVLVPSAELCSLVNLAVESVLGHLWEGGILVPEVFTVSTAQRAPEGRAFGDHRRVDTDLAASLRSARNFVDELMPERCLRYAWAFDGYVGSQHHEAVIIEAAESENELHDAPRAASAWRLAARYRFSKTGISLLDRDLIVIENVHTPFSAR